jgi:hypothetical protein
MNVTPVRIIASFPSTSGPGILFIRERQTVRFPLFVGEILQMKSPSLVLVFWFGRRSERRQRTDVRCRVDAFDKFRRHSRENLVHRRWISVDLHPKDRTSNPIEPTSQHFEAPYSFFKRTAKLEKPRVSLFPEPHSDHGNCSPAPTRCLIQITPRIPYIIRKARSVSLYIKNSQRSEIHVPITVHFISYNRD